MSTVSIKLTLNSLESAARTFLNEIGSIRKVAFYGNMGAGKTTFITALCKELKAIDLVSSPTFAIVNEYETESGTLIHHFDFYRIKDPVELFDIGFEEYLDDDGSWCFIEWPEKANNLLTEDFIEVHIDTNEDGSRTLHF